MRKFTLVSMIMALCILFSCSLVQAQEMRTIAVDGISTIKVAPNKATVNISITNSAKNSKEAANKNAAVMNKIQSALLGLTITEENIQTTNYSLYPIYDAKSNSREITGYSVTNEISVNIDNIALVGIVIDTAINSGASNVDSIEFGLKDSQQYKEKALREAILDAKRKAEVVASTLGKNIVNVVSVNTNNTYIETRNMNNAMYMKSSADMSASSPVQEGEINVRSNVSVVFEMN